MRAKLTGLIPYAADFWLLPFPARNTGTAMLLMLCVMPAAAFVTALVYGMRRGLSLLLPAAAFLLFLPAVFIHYNTSAWVYAMVYAVVVLAGNGVGRIFYGRR